MDVRVAEHSEVSSGQVNRCILAAAETLMLRLLLSGPSGFECSWSAWARGSLKPLLTAYSQILRGVGVDGLRVDSTKSVRKLPAGGKPRCQSK